MTISRLSHNGLYPFDVAQDECSVTSEIITTDNAFAALKQSWNTLASVSQETHPFILWEWQHTWWDVFSGVNDQLYIIAVYKNNQIVGLAPFYLKKLPIGKSLRYLGEGEKYQEAVCTHYPDLLCSSENQEMVINEIARHLNKHKHHWDYAHFSFVLDNSLLHKLKKKLSLFIRVQKSLGQRYLLNLPESNDEFLATLGKSTRKNFRSKRNRMEKQAGLSLTQLDLQHSPQASLDTLANLHRTRQANKNEKCVFDQSRFKSFHQKLLNRLEDTNIAEMKALKHGGEIVAVAYNYIIDQKVYSYASGFESRDDKRYSPMLVFDFLEIESLIKKGFKQYDFLSTTDGGSYKKYYRCEEFPVNELCWFKPTTVAFGKYSILELRTVAARLKRNVKERFYKFK